MLDFYFRRKFVREVHLCLLFALRQVEGRGEDHAVLRPLLRFHPNHFRFVDQVCVLAGTSGLYDRPERRGVVLVGGYGGLDVNTSTALAVFAIGAEVEAFKTSRELSHFINVVSYNP